MEEGIIKVIKILGENGINSDRIRSIELDWRFMDNGNNLPRVRIDLFSPKEGKYPQCLAYEPLKGFKFRRENNSGNLNNPNT